MIKSILIYNIITLDIFACLVSYMAYALITIMNIYQNVEYFESGSKLTKLSNYIRIAALLKCVIWMYKHRTQC